MGLDVVELVIEVEEVFGFSIDDKKAEALETVGDLYDYIIEHRFQNTQNGCLSSVTFYKLRCALMSVLSIPRKDVRLNTKLADLIPRHRRKLWRNLRKTLALRLPELHRAKGITTLAVMTIILISLTAMILVAKKYGGHAATRVGVISILGLILFFYRITIPLATEFHSGIATVGNLTKEILSMNYGAISEECGRANADEVWESLRSIIVEQLGVSRDAVTREARFVDLFN